jgi:hypothetical protein
VTYHTTDLNVAAYLVAKGHPLRAIEGEVRRRMFVFDEGARADAPKFFTDDLVGARTFAAAMKMLKSALHG